MKNLIVIISFLISLQVSLFAQSKELLTNEIVISLVDIGLTSDVINAKIISSETDFDVLIEDLMYLKDKNVPSDVIKTMINHQSKMQSESAGAKLNKTGIFHIVAGEEEQILPTVFSATKTRILASALTYGIASAKVKSTMTNATSSLVISPDELEFIFYFSPFKENQFVATDWWFRVTSSPTEFALVRLNSNVRKNIREIETGKVNLWIGTDSGLESETVVRCEVLKIEDGKYSVKPSVTLESGEYCFFFAGTIPQGGYTNQSVFDFSVK